MGIEDNDSKLAVRALYAEVLFVVVMSLSELNDLADAATLKKYCLRNAGRNHGDRADKTAAAFRRANHYIRSPIPGLPFQGARPSPIAGDLPADGQHPEIRGVRATAFACCATPRHLNRMMAFRADIR